MDMLARKLLFGLMTVVFSPSSSPLHTMGDKSILGGVMMLDRMFEEKYLTREQVSQEVQYLAARDLLRGWTGEVVQTLSFKDVSGKKWVFAPEKYREHPEQLQALPEGMYEAV